MRGQIISYEATSKKQTAKLLEIEGELNSLLQSDYDRILKLKYEHSSIIGQQINNLLLKLKHRHFESGDKPDKLLGRQFKREQAKPEIYKIKSRSGALITDLKFYSETYTSQSTDTQKDCDMFFDSLKLPQVKATS